MAELYRTTSGHKYHAGTIAIIMVGLPARGKTFMSRKIARYLRWLGIRTRVFNVSNYRRQWLGSKLPHGFFDPVQDNKSFADERTRIGNIALNDMIQWFDEGGQVGIYDAGNTQESRRNDILNVLTERRVMTLFLEAICDTTSIVESNIRDVKITAPDYHNVEEEKAVQDYLKRIAWYQSTYKTIDDPNQSYIKIINAGENIIVNQVQGYLQSRLVYYLTNLHIGQRTIYLCRHGESTHSTTDYTMDAGLSELGRSFTTQLKDFLERHRSAAQKNNQLVVWTSTRRRAREMAEILGYPCSHKNQLGELNLGVCNGMTEVEIQSQFPLEYVRHLKSPYLYRFSRGESYLDLANRLEYCILELERETRDVMICAHETVLRCLYAYLADRSQTEIPFITFPRHVVLELVPRAYGFQESRYFVHPIKTGIDSYTTILQDEFKPYQDSV